VQIWFSTSSKSRPHTTHIRGITKSAIALMALLKLSLRILESIQNKNKDFCYLFIINTNSLFLPLLKFIHKTTLQIQALFMPGVF
jgi:hypothetical protein